MPVFKKSHWYRHVKKKSGVDVIPLNDREVPIEIFAQYIEVDRKEEKKQDVD